MKRCVLLGALVVAALLPLAVVMYGGPVTCCYGTTCPTYPGCTLSYGQPGAWHCKRLCTPQCTEGNKCCQYRFRTCTWTNGDCPPPSSEVVDVSVWEYRQCKVDGTQVECLQTAQTECN